MTPENMESTLDKRPLRRPRRRRRVTEAQLSRSGEKLHQLVLSSEPSESQQTAFFTQLHELTFMQETRSRIYRPIPWAAAQTVAMKGYLPGEGVDSPFKAVLLDSDMPPDFQEHDRDLVISQADLIQEMKKQSPDASFVALVVYDKRKITLQGTGGYTINAKRSPQKAILGVVIAQVRTR